MFGRRATVAHHGAAPMPTGSGGPMVPQTDGWAPFGHGQHPSDQIGAYDGGPLNQWPAYIPGVQLNNGVQYLRSGWYTPTRSVIPNAQTYATVAQANLPGAQRVGSRYTGPIGPITARLFKQQVTAESIRGTAMQAQPWAAGMVPDWARLPVTDE
jgi:hypothetical protein